MLSDFLSIYALSVKILKYRY